MRKSPRTAVATAALGIALAAAGTAAAAERIAVGDEAPTFNLQSSQGDSYNLEAQRGEKNVLLVFYRGTW